MHALALVSRINYQIALLRAAQPCSRPLNRLSELFTRIMTTEKGAFQDFFFEDACRQLLSERPVRRCIMEPFWRTHDDMGLCLCP